MNQTDHLYTSAAHLFIAGAIYTYSPHTQHPSTIAYIVGHACISVAQGMMGSHRVYNDRSATTTTSTSSTYKYYEHLLPILLGILGHGLLVIFMILYQQAPPPVVRVAFIVGQAIMMYFYANHDQTDRKIGSVDGFAIQNRDVFRVAFIGLGLFYLHGACRSDTDVEPVVRVAMGLIAIVYLNLLRVV